MRFCETNPISYAERATARLARGCPLLDQSGQKWILARDWMSANDPKRTFGGSGEPDAQIPPSERDTILRLLTICRRWDRIETIFRFYPPRYHFNRAEKPAAPRIAAGRVYDVNYGRHQYKSIAKRTKRAIAISRGIGDCRCTDTHANFVDCAFRVCSDGRICACRRGRTCAVHRPHVAIRRLAPALPCRSSRSRDVVDLRLSDRRHL